MPFSLSTRAAKALCTHVLSGVVAVFPLTALAGCTGEQSLVLVPGQRTDPLKVDNDPVSILPAGILAFTYVDAAKLFQSGLGSEVSGMVQSLLPLPPTANFVASRDVTRIFAGTYAMQGADFCAVIQGNFDTEAIRRSVDTGAVSLAGVPLVKSRYADSDVYTSGNIGFTMLTAHTLISGNETGIRRALDRIRFSKLERAVPAWMTELGRTPGAAFSLAGDFSTQSPGGSAVQNMPFLTGATQVRVIGNYLAPGMNLAGTITFADDAAAGQAESSLNALSSLAPFMNFLSSFGLGINIPPIKTARKEKEVAFTVPMDDGTARALLRKGGDVLKATVKIGQQRQ
ncbi:MAG: hypothetical protein IPK82_17120 [Polyangiaceae bacterium]|nr:hypothetical protein [Polyangiaceae bacterium]